MAMEELVEGELKGQGKVCEVAGPSHCQVQERTLILVDINFRSAKKLILDGDILIEHADADARPARHGCGRAIVVHSVCPFVWSTPSMGLVRAVGYGVSSKSLLMTSRRTRSERSLDTRGLYQLWAHYSQRYAKVKLTTENA